MASKRIASKKITTSMHTPQWQTKMGKLPQQQIEWQIEE